MAIDVECGACFHTFRVAEKFAGRRGKCPECGESVRVPSAAAAADVDEHELPPRSAPAAGSRRSKASKKKRSSAPQSLNTLLGIGGAVAVVALLAIVLMRGSGAPEVVANPAAAAQQPDQAAAEIAAAAATPLETVPDVSGAATQQTAVNALAGSPAIPVQAPMPAAGDAGTATLTTARPVKANTTLPAVSTAAPASAPLLPAPAPLTTAELVRLVEPSIVRINALDEEDELEWHGSGFLIDASGVVATNHHVISGAHKCVAEFASGTKCEVKGYYILDEKRDIALLQIDLPEGQHHPLPLAANSPAKGEQVLAFGCPYGLDFSTTDGLVSAFRSAGDIKSMLGADVEGEWLQTSAPVSPGNSGGPLVNMLGEVVGINSMVRSEGQNLNFAIVAAEVRSMFDRRGESLTALSRATKSKDGQVSLAGSRAAEKYLAEIDTVLLTTRVQGAEGSRDMLEMVRAYTTKSLRSTGIGVTGVKGINSPYMIVTMEVRDGVETGTCDVAIAAQLLVPTVVDDDVFLMIVWEKRGEIGSPKIYKLRKDYRSELKDGLTKFFADVETEITAARKRKD